MSEQETIYLQDQRVTVTNSRAIIDGKTFAMANITSVSWATEAAKKLWPVVMLILGGLLTVVGIVVWIVGDTSTMWCTALSAIVAIVGFVLLRAAKAKHIVKIGSASGEQRALVTTDQEYAQRVAGAMNEAIVGRG